MSDISSFSPLWGEWYIKDLLGEGSFGAVYRAEKNAYGNTYVSAVKHITIPCKGMNPDELIYEGTVADINSVKSYYDDLRDQFIKEINVCYALRGHTNIVAYEDHCIIPKKSGLGYDIFIRMEYLTALTANMRSHKMTENDVIKLGIDICTALEVLNDSHLLHRDIKPANIFMNSKGIYKLGDFGEAKVLSGYSIGMSIRGTYAYMSPEISQGLNANITADIYSLGLVMYRLLNGNRPPFVPVSTPKISAQMQETANTRRFKGELLPVPAYVKSPELCSIIMKACEYKPQDRWQDPEDMKEALTALRKAMKAPKPKPVVSSPAPKSVVPETSPVVPEQKPAPQVKETAVSDQETIPVSSVKSAVPIPPPAKTVPVSDQVTIPVSAVKPVQKPAPVKSVEDTPVKKKSKMPIIVALIVAAVLAIAVPVIIGIANNSKDNNGSESTLGTIVASGNCGKNGDNVTYQLDDNGLLVISGTGEMEDYDYMNNNHAPWHEKRESIKTVIITNGVTSIGRGAFYECTSLTSITIPDSVTSIGNGAFWPCTSLTSITIPDSVTSIGADALDNTSWYKSQPDGVLYTGKVAYKYKGKMPANTNIVLKEGTKGIAGGAFYNCTSLTSITIPDGVTSIGNGAFWECTSLTSITIPDSVTSIGKSAFYKCTSLTSITIPDSVTSIGGGAFWECTSLTSINIPDGVTSIGESAFYNCKSLESITIPDSVTSIGVGAFHDCTSLSSITIPDSVTSIGYSAFYGWKSSQTIYIKGRSKAPSGWDEGWNKGLFLNIEAKIVWNA